MSKVSELLRANNQATTKKSKVPVQGADSLHDQVYQAHQALTVAKSAYDELKKQLLERTNVMYQENATTGTFSKSFNLPGYETPGVQVSYKDQFTAIKVENEEALKDVMGDKYHLYFHEKRETTLVDTTDEMINLLISVLGEEKFLLAFKTKSTISPKPDMDRRQFDLPDNARSYLTQYEASVKVNK